MTDYRRVYHPTLNAWQDVAKSDGDKWKAAGWRLTKPEHVDDSEALPPGEHPGYAQIPVLEDTSRTVTSTATSTTTSSSPAAGRARPRAKPARPRSSSSTTAPSDTSGT